MLKLTQTIKQTEAIKKFFQSRRIILLPLGKQILTHAGFTGYRNESSSAFLFIRLIITRNILYNPLNSKHQFMNNLQLIHCAQSLEEAVNFLGRDLYKLQSKVEDLESEIEDLKLLLSEDRTSEIAQIVARLEYIERSIDAPFYNN